MKNSSSILICTFLASLVCVVAWGQTIPLDNPPPCTDGSSHNVMCVGVDLYDPDRSTAGLIQDHQISSYPPSWADDITFVDDDNGPNDVAITSFARDGVRMTGQGGDASLTFGIPAQIQSTVPAGSWYRRVPRYTKSVYLVVTAINAGRTLYDQKIGEVVLTFLDASGGMPVEKYDLISGKNIRNWFGGTIIYYPGTNQILQQILYEDRLHNGLSDTFAWEKETYTRSAPSGTQILPATLDILRLDVPSNLYGAELQTISVVSHPKLGYAGNPVSIKVMGISTLYIPPKLVFEYPAGVLTGQNQTSTPTGQNPATLKLVSPAGDVISDYDGTALEWDCWSGSWAVDPTHGYQNTRNNPLYRDWEDIGPIPLGTWRVREPGLNLNLARFAWLRLDELNVDPSGSRTDIYIHQTPVLWTHGCIGIKTADPMDLSRTSFYTRFGLAPGVRVAIDKEKMKLEVKDSLSRTYYPEPPTPPEWTFTPKSPVTILVVDAYGYRCGYDTATGQIVNDFEGAAYTGPGTDPQVVTIPGLGTGADSFEVVLSPVGAGGAYTLEISHSDLDGSVISTQVTGSIGPGEEGRYTVEKSGQSIMVNGTPGGTNMPPSTDAGPDQTVEGTSPAGAPVTLDGSGSSDDGLPQPLTYSWTWPGGSATGVNPTVTLPLGLTTITLTVYDGQFSDTATVGIAVVDTIPPFVDAGPDLQSAQVTLNGWALDICDPALDYQWSEGGVVLGYDATLIHTFNPGTHELKLEAVDDSGNIGVDTVIVAVVDTTALAVNIDIYPNRVPNRVILSRNYTLYVAVQGSASFDVTTLNSSTVKFGKTGTEAGPVRAPLIRDLNGDGFGDAMYGFMTNSCGFALGDTEGVLTGKLTDGTDVEGSDSVLVTP